MVDIFELSPRLKEFNKYVGSALFVNVGKKKKKKITNWIFNSYKYFDFIYHRVGGLNEAKSLRKAIFLFIQF